MMEQREKLIELLNQYRECLYDEKIDCNDCDYKDAGECFNARLADNLIANGVVVLPCRCCECEYSDVAYCQDGKTESKTDIWCVYNENRHKNNYYCADGKRKGDE